MQECIRVKIQAYIELYKKKRNYGKIFFSTLYRSMLVHFANLMVVLDVDMESIKQKFPHWSYEDIMDIKAQFQTFDVNQDGLIDFVEL